MEVDLIVNKRAADFIALNRNAKYYKNIEEGKGRWAFFFQLK